MKTDIKEKEDKYIIDIDLPVYEKDKIKVEIHDKYLVMHTKANKEDNKEKRKYVRKERYTGECSRSFYVGDNIKEENTKAKFHNGALTLEIPKKENKKELIEKKYIPID